MSEHKTAEWQIIDELQARIATLEQQVRWLEEQRDEFRDQYIAAKHHRAEIELALTVKLERQKGKAERRVEKLYREIFRLDRCVWRCQDILAPERRPALSVIQVPKRVQKWREALESIAANTCCDRCQEAALVAKEALELGDKSGD
jgi:outer membrane murein-binding lipoprotein Lpp